MKHFTKVADVANVQELVQEALHLKKDPYAYQRLGRNKTLGLVFFNPSLRTRLSTQLAARNLGMDVMVMNINTDGWKLEMNDGVIMDGDSSEHVHEAAGVLSRYCQIIGIRAFPSLKDRDADYQEHIIGQFMRYAKVPVLSLESATRHPLQSLADIMTIEEHRPKNGQRPKVVLTWAPHPKPLPQAVPNSFCEWVGRMDYNFVITHPDGYRLDTQFTGKTIATSQQLKALEQADFVYVKNWSSFQHYGQVINKDPSWTLTNRQLAVTRQAKVMHCLPVRRNVVIADEVLDGPQSIVLDQAENRIYSAQAVLKRMLENIR